MDTLAAMRAFVRIVEAGTVSGAAERLNLAKSAVSRRLAELEDHLGVQLLTRTTRRLALTDHGGEFYERCVQILADVEDAAAAVAAADTELKGRLRIAAPLSFGLRHLGPAINEFIDGHPELEFELDFHDRQVDLIQEGFDLAVRIAELEDSTLVARRLTRINHVVVASPSYWHQHGQPKTPDELAGHAGLHYSNAARLGWRYTAPNGCKGQVRLASRLQASNGDYLTEAAAAGYGVAMQPSFIVYQCIEQGRLVPVLTEYSWPTLNAYALYPRTRHLPNRVRVFVDFLAARFGGLPYWDACLNS